MNPAAYDNEGAVRRATVLGRLLDRSFIDPILGAILPGAGDLITAGLGLYIVFVAARCRVSPVVIARMLANLAIDTTIGAVPIVGDITDIFYRANLRNLELLNARHAERKATASDWAVLAGALLLVAAAIAVPIALMVWALSRVF